MFYLNHLIQNFLGGTDWTLHNLQVVESGGKNIEVAVMTHEDGLRELEEAEIDEYVAEIEAEKAAAEAAKKGAQKET